MKTRLSPALSKAKNQAMFRKKWAVGGLSLRQICWQAVLFVGLFMHADAFSATQEGEDTIQPCDPFYESLSDGLHNCVGQKCQNIWVYTTFPEDLSQQAENYKIVNLSEYEAEFRARIALSIFIESGISSKTEMHQNKSVQIITQQILLDPFKAISFDKKFLCRTTTEGLFYDQIKFFGVLP